MRFTASLLKVRRCLQWQLIRFLHSDIALQEHFNKEDVANTRREKTTIHATVPALATVSCSYAPLRRT